MNKTQERLLELMKKFDRLCRENEIVYYLGGGSALGAVRHQGFLPWDDDVDLYMTRDNYEKLISAKDRIFSEDFILVNHDEYPHYGNTLVRCVYPYDCAITKARIVDGTPKGSFVEIFIMDPMPRDKEEQTLWLQKHYVYTELMAFCFRVSNSRVDQWVNPELYDYYYKRSETEGRDVVLKELEAELFSISEEDSDEYCSRWGMRNLFYDVAWFSEPRYVPFEDTTLPVPTDAESVLRFDYGDSWMYIPQGDDQVVHTFADSTEIGYQAFVDDYSRFIDSDEVRSVYPPRKEAGQDWYFVYRSNHRKRTALKEGAVNASLAYRGITPEKVRGLYKAEAYSELKSIFDGYYQTQFSTAFWGWEIPLRIDSELMFCALAPLFIEGEYSKVRKILLWVARDFSLSSDCVLLLEACNQVRDAYICIDHKDFRGLSDCVRDLSGSALGCVKGQFDFRYLSIFESVQNDSVDSELENSAKDLLRDYPDNGEVMSLLADVLMADGKREESLPLFRRALDNTNHGFVLRHVKSCINELEGGRYGD